MAQPGNFTPILLYGSSTPTNVPLAANLTNSATGSEIAINVADKNLFFKDSGGVVNTVPIRQSSTSSNGWLSATDWNTFNNKASATSGTSILYGNGSGGFSNVTIGSGISFAGGTLSATGTGGTVTSVAASVPAFLSVAGSPITTSGTLAITLSGTALPVANGGTGQTSFTAGQIHYGSFSTSANLFWDATNSYLGVGTNAPSNYGRLAVVGSAANQASALGAIDSTVAVIVNTAASALSQKASLVFQTTPQAKSVIAGYYANFNGAGDTASGLIFGTQLNLAGGVVERMRITETGGICIGNTTDPGAGNLYVNGNLRVGTSIASSTLTVATNLSAYDVGAATKLELQQSGQDGYINMTGTSNIVIRTGAGFTQVAVINGTTGVYTATSDINKKKDFESSTLGLNAILQLKPTLYRMTDQDSDSPKELGFIAQEVKDIIPQAYIESKTSEGIIFIGLQDRPMIAVLAKAIQELSAKFDAYVASHP